MQLKNISGIGTFAVEWEGESGSRYQLSAGHGEQSLWFSAQTDSGNWLSQQVASPERFGVTRPLQRFSQFQAAARRFTEACDGSTD